MSHNIGSHVLSKYKTEDDLYSSNHNIQYKAQSLNLNGGVSDKKTHAYFNEYLKNRMDFLADIATTDPTLETPLYLLKDILSGFDKNRILLNRISGLDNNIQFDLAVHRRKRNGDLIEIQGDDTTDDLLLSIPNDVLGCQALYIIIENLIRNVAKHAKAPTSSSRIFEFTINILVEEYLENPNYYQISLYDSLEKEISDIEEIVTQRNELLNSPVINEKNNSFKNLSLRDLGLGSIEMDVCAAYLRKIPLVEIENELYTITEDKYKEKNGAKIPNILHAYSHQTENNKATLGYKMYLRKPQKLLIFDDKNSLNLSPDEIEKRRTEGITILSTDLNSSNQFKSHWEYSHEFLIWLNEEGEFDNFYNSKENKSYKNILPRRILFKSDFGENGFQLSKTSFESEKNVWSIYLPKLLRKSNVSGFKVSLKSNPDHAAFPLNCENPKKIFIDNHDENWELYRLKNDVYYEMRCSHHRLKKLNLANKNFYHLESYLETVLTEVIIIDERIQANIVNNKRKYGKVVSLKEYFERMKVFIPSASEVNLNNSNFGTLSENTGTDLSVADSLKQYLLGSINNPGKIQTADFCVIHLGVIEKLFAENEIKDKTAVEEKIKNLVGDENVDKVVITTGRGKPTNLSENFRYIPLAIIQNNTETLFDKYLLVKSLFNARKPK